jgi:hypothetical protein
MLTSLATCDRAVTGGVASQGHPDYADTRYAVGDAEEAGR